MAPLLGAATGATGAVGAVGEAAQQSTANNEDLLKAVLIFGAVALVVAAAVQWKAKKSFASANFARVYGLAFIATLAAAIVFANVSDGARTGAYTVLGTIAGYLVSTRPTSATAGGETVSAGDAQGRTGAAPPTPTEETGGTAGDEPPSPDADNAAI